MASSFRPSLRLGLLLGALMLAACGQRAEKKDAPAKEAKLPPPLMQFEGYLYVHPSTSEFKILELVRAETRSVFTGLRKSKVMVSRRDVDRPSAERFKKEAAIVVDPATGERSLAVRVRYRYVARPDSVQGLDESGAKKDLTLALLHRDVRIDAQRVLRECTANTEQDKAYSSAIALVFDASLASCKAAVQAEQAAIDAARAKIAAEAARSGEQLEDGAIPREEAERLYVPVRVTLERVPRLQGEVAPRYAPVDAKDEEVKNPAPERPAEAEPPEPEVVIVDPDLKPSVPTARPLNAEAALLPEAPSKHGAESSGDSRLPRVVAPSVSQAPRKWVVEEQPRDEPFEIPFETLADPKFIVVWVSLLMAYPILRGDPRKRKKT